MKNDMNFDSYLAPVWQLPVTCDEDGPFGRIKNNVKYHCFVNNESLCGARKQNTEDYDDGITIASAAVLEQPHEACKRCLAKWKKLYQVEG